MNREPDLRQLRTFVAVAEEMHFTRAADRLNIGQQGLSAQIRRLEEQLGVALFRRTTRHVELTDAGKALLAHARPLIMAASEAWEVVQLADTGDAGTLLVGYSPTARTEMLSAVIAEIRDVHPRLELRCTEYWGGCDGILNGLTDVAFIRLLSPIDPRIHATVIKESRVGLLIAASHPLAKRDGIDLVEMKDHTIEMPARGLSFGFQEALLELLEAHGFSGNVREYHNLTGRFMLDDREACERVISGMTVGFGFEGQYPDLPEEIVWVPLDPAVYAPLLMWWREDVGPTMRNFINATLDLSARSGWLRQAPHDAHV